MLAGHKYPNAFAHNWVSGRKTTSRHSLHLIFIGTSFAIVNTITAIQYFRSRAYRCDIYGKSMAKWWHIVLRNDSIFVDLNDSNYVHSDRLGFGLLFAMLFNFGLDKFSFNTRKSAFECENQNQTIAHQFRFAKSTSISFYKLVSIINIRTHTMHSPTANSHNAPRRKRHDFTSSTATNCTHTRSPARAKYTIPIASKLKWLANQINKHASIRLVFHFACCATFNTT